MSIKKLYGGIEAGGTKFVCGIGSGSGELIACEEVPTTLPEDTLERVVKFFQSQPLVESFGIGSFGPIDLNIHSKQYGKILNTPKPGWSGTNLLSYLRRSFDKNIIFATDTDVAAIGEYYHGIGLGNTNLVYLTVGTGIGGSALTNGTLLHGLSHPEMGHVRIPIVNASDEGVCLFHANCLEGVASGKALEHITGTKAELIADDSIWSQEAQYIAMGLTNIIMITQPERIILGGSVLKHAGLLEQIQSETAKLVNEYLVLPNMHSYIVHASSDTIGVLGAIKLATL
jgi:fructokinase